MKLSNAMTIIGWREWVALPDFEVVAIKAKIDSGAKTSALHVTHVKKVGHDVYFRVHPHQDEAEPHFEAKARFLEYRWVKSSNGVRDERPVVKTTIRMGEEEFPIELTLVNRDLMGFRMLIGREALRKRFLIDTAASFRLKKASKKFFKRKHR